MRTLRPLGILGLAALFLGAVAQERFVAEPFNGRDLTGWRGKEDSGPENRWRVGGATLDPERPDRFVIGEGVELVNDVTGHGQSQDLYSEATYGDVWITLEVKVPRGSNSGIYVMGEYEVQILDSYGRDENPRSSDMGALYGAQPPQRPRYRAPGEWNQFEIWFRAPRFNAAGEKVEHARFMRVVLNGVVIHENVEVRGSTPGGIDGREKPTGPLMFQGNHGAVSIRNLKMRPIGNVI